MCWMGNNRKRIGFLVFPLAIALLVSGCTRKTYVSDEKKAENQGELILEAIKNNDPDGLVAVFSEYAVRVCDLQTEAEELLDFIDGNIVSVGEIDDSGSSGSYRQDDTGYEEYQMYIDEVRTDTSGEYSIQYDYFVGDYPEHQRNGINHIYILDRSAYTAGEGYAESGTQVMGVE